MKIITSETAYSKALADIDKLMAKGDENITETEAQFIEETAKAISAYEAMHYPFPFSKTIGESVEPEIFEENRIVRAS
jgi:antitoxin component HigA of HigAB toxin-antitoxin module